MSEKLVPRILALQLLRVALQDCVRPLACKWDQVSAARRDAIDFLFSEERKEDVKMWCSFADINYRNFLSRAREVYENKIDISKVEAELVKEIKATSTEEDEDEE